MKKLFLTSILLVVPQLLWGAFRAADLVVIPAAAAASGLQGSNWHTDVEIMNVDSVPVDVMLVFLPTGNFDNTFRYDTFTNHLGGRSEDGFTKVDPRLKDIQPGQAVLLENVIEAHWGQNSMGALLVFAFTAGSFKQTTPPGGEPRKILVWSRTYNKQTAEDGTVSTFGQAIPGIPWYYYIDPHQEARGLNKVVFSGIREDAAFRTNIGLVNLSDRLTTLEVELVLYDAQGTKLKERGVILRPLAHLQFDQAAKRGLFGLEEDLAFGTVEISVKAWRSSAAEPTPALLAYVSRVDNVTNDAVFLEQSFTKEFPWDCVFNGNCSPQPFQSLSMPRLFHRPLYPPHP